MHISHTVRVWYGWRWHIYEDFRQWDTPCSVIPKWKQRHSDYRTWARIDEE